MRRAGRFVLALVLTLLCAGAGSELLPHPQEMGELALVRVIGVDAAEQEVELTASTGTRGQRRAVTVSARGSSVSAAARSAQGMGESYLYYGHADKLLLGQEAAESLLPQVVDYLCRERMQGLGAQMWVVRDGTARDGIGSGSGADVALRLERLAMDGGTGRALLSCTAMELAGALAEERSTYLPAVAVDETGELMPDGYAVLRKGVLVCFAQDDCAAGLELLEEHGQGRVETLTLPDGTQVGLELGRTRTRARAELAQGELTGLEVRLDLPTRVVQCPRELTANDADWIERELGILEGQRVVQTLELAQYWDADFPDLRTKACRGDLLRAGKINGSWDDEFRALDIKVQAYCRMEQSMEITGR